MQCDICGSPMSFWFQVPGDWRKPSVDCSFPVRRCARDGFARVDPTPSVQVLRDHYDIEEYYTHSDSLQKTKIRTPFLFKIITKFALFFDRGAMPAWREVETRLRPGARVLDLGAGGGETLLKLKDMGYDVVGIEPDPNAHSLSVNFPVPVYQGTGEEIPDDIKGQKFDMIISNHVLEHTTHPMDVLRNVHSLLVPGGHFIAEVPNIDCVDFRLKKLNWQHLGVPRHLVFWRQSSLMSAASKAGFAKSDIHYRHYVRQFLWEWVKFGKPMVKFYKSRGSYRFSLKSYSTIYYSLLFFSTALLPSRLKYDSVVLIATRDSTCE
jgi:2-polyprenyl-3-methyl-5-hydroxy-6-metoxy-1,4-benzoquinol methylase